MSTNTNRVNNPMKVITGPDTRWSYANVWEPKSINGGTPKYSVSLIIPKSDTVTVQKIKAAIQEIVEKYKWVLNYDHRRVLRTLLDKNNMLAVLCFLMNEEARGICFAPDPVNLTFPAGSDNYVIYEKIKTLLGKSDVLAALGDNLKSFAGVTDGYWKDLKPKGQKYMLLSIGVGDFARSAGVIGGDLGSAQINGKFPVVDGIDYKSNSSMRTMLYMEV